MKLNLSLALFLAIISFPSGVAAQGETLSEADYNAALAAVLNSTSARDRRIITEEHFYTNEQTTGHRKIVSEFVGNNARRVAIDEDFGGKAAAKGVVVIGDRVFCREGKREWKRAAGECAKVNMVPIPDGKYEYFVETEARNPSVKTYIRRATFEDAGSPDREAARLKFIEIRVLADENGMIEYRETRRGGIEAAGWRSTQVTKYFYEPADLRISDPTKEN